MSDNNTFNSTTNTTTSPPRDEWTILLSFAVRVSENPVAATTEYPGVILLLLSFTLLPMLLRRLIALTVDKVIS